MVYLDLCAIMPIVIGTAVAQQTDWVQVMPPVPGMAEAEMWRGMLAEHDIVALVRPNDASLYLGPNSFCHVLVAVAMLHGRRN